MFALTDEEVDVLVTFFMNSDTRDKSIDPLWERMVEYIENDMRT